MAFLDASPATAESTLLCKTNTTASMPTLAAECNPISSVHFKSVDSLGIAPAKVKLLNSFATVECNVLITGTTTQALVNNGPVEFNATLTYTECNCEVSVLENGTISILRTGEELAEITASEFRIKIACFGVFTCDYNTANLVGHGLPATFERLHLTYSKNELNLQQDLASPFGSCPSMSLDALFKSASEINIRL
jgi:hypothetical protein